MKIILFGPIKGGKNHVQITRTGHRYPNKKWAEWRDGMIKQVRGQLPSRFLKINVPCRAVIQYWKPDERRRDVPAAVDAIWHVLEHAYVIADDALIKELNWIDKGLDRKNPRAEIDLEVIEDIKWQISSQSS